MLMEMKNRKCSKEFFRFILVGCINTLVGTSVMFLFYNIFGLHYWISTSSNYIIGSIVSYFLNKYFTFKDYSHNRRQMLNFALNITFCYCFAYGIAYYALIPILKKILGIKLSTNIAMLFGMCGFVIFNYLGQRHFVFYRKEK